MTSPLAAAAALTMAAQAPTARGALGIHDLAPGISSTPGASSPSSALGGAGTLAAAAAAGGGLTASASGTASAASTPAANGGWGSAQAAFAQWQAATAQSSLSATARQELTLALQSDQLGPLNVHMALHGDALAATISVSHPDSGKLLESQLPSLQRDLERQGRVSSLLVQQRSPDSGRESGGNAQRQQQPQSGPAFNAPVADVADDDTSFAAAQVNVRV